MATKAELLAQAQEQGLDVNTKTTKDELVSMLSDNDSSSSTNDSTGSSNGETSGGTDNAESVEVNSNENGEATNGTTQDGSDSEVANTDSVPQNGQSDIETAPTTDNPVAVQADEDRTEDEIKFADESNPNQKARNAATEGQEYDQDGLPRTGGKSYGVSADDSDGTVFEEQNKGEEPEEAEESMTGRVANEPTRIGEYLNPTPENDNDDTNNSEWSTEDQQKLEESLSIPGEGVRARVTTSAGNYVRIKFFRNNKPLGTYRSRNFSEGDAASFRDKLMDEVVSPVSDQE